MFQQFPNHSKNIKRNSQFSRLSSNACSDNLKQRLPPICKRTLRRQMLEYFRFAGHSFIMGKEKNGWQSVNKVLALFGRKKRVARDACREFFTEGIELGRQPDLVGGGLIRSAGGWTAVQSLRKAGLLQNSDERILGDGDFVASVLNRLLGTGKIFRDDQDRDFSSLGLAI